MDDPNHPTATPMEVAATAGSREGRLEQCPMGDFEWREEKLGSLEWRGTSVVGGQRPYWWWFGAKQERQALDETEEGSSWLATIR